MKKTIKKIIFFYILIKFNVRESWEAVNTNSCTNLIQRIKINPGPAIHWPFTLHVFSYTPRVFLLTQTLPSPNANTFRRQSSQAKSNGRKPATSWSPAITSSCPTHFSLSLFSLRSNTSPNIPFPYHPIWKILFSFLLPHPTSLSVFLKVSKVFCLSLSL